MCKKMLFMVAFLVLGFVGTSLADTIVWNGEGTDDNWCTGDNWNVDGVPWDTDYAVIGDWDVNSCGPVVIDSNSTCTVECDTLLLSIRAEGAPAYLTIDAVGLTATGNLYMGYEAGGDGTLTINGGNTTAGGAVVVGEYGTGTLNMNGGTLTSTWQLFVGYRDGGVGDVNITDGTINPNSNVHVGYLAGSEGTLIMSGGTADFEVCLIVADQGDGRLVMTGGTINSTWQLFVGYGGGIGHVDLHGGTINAYSLVLGQGGAGTGTMDVTEGTLVMPGDLRTTINGYIADGLITGYSGRVSPSVVYDSGYTTVSAPPADVNVAWGPIPLAALAGLDRNDPNARVLWLRGDTAAFHDVYFGDNFDDVNNATVGNPLGVYKGRQADANENSYDPGSLELGETCYWRIDEVESDGTTIHRGTIWQFDVDINLLVDNFDLYADTNDLLATWTSTGPDSVELETEIALGTEAMKADFNDAGSVSRDVPFADWTQAGVEGLTFFFHGAAANGANAQQLYVKLEDGSTSATVAYDGDGNDLIQNSWDGWQMWNIALDEFTDVNLTNVTKITIGITGTSSDTVYFDDLRIYIPRCEPSLAVGDFTGDCVVNMDDLEIFAEDWLKSRSYTTGIDGELINFPGDDSQWVAGHGTGNALDFDGNDDYVSMGDVEELKLTDALTLSAWVKLDSIPAEGSALITGRLLHYWFEWYCSEWLNFGTFINGSQESNGVVIHLADGAWHHIAMTYDGTTKIGYHNGGAALFTDTLPGKIGSPYPHDFEIGAGFPPSSTAFDGCPDGRIDDVRVYDYALTWDEVKYLADAGGTAPATAPVGWWKLDESSGLIAEDSGSNANNQIYQPLARPEVDLNDDGKIDFVDYAGMAGKWLEEQMWP